MLLTACVFGSGIMLAVTGPSFGSPSGWLVVHRISFIAWVFFIAIHVLAYVPRLPRLLTAEARGVAGPQGEAGRHAGAGRHARRAMEVLGGRGTRLTLLIASLLGGLVIALLTVHLAGKWEPFGQGQRSGWPGVARPVSYATTTAGQHCGPAPLQTRMSTGCAACSVPTPTSASTAATRSFSP